MERVQGHNINTCFFRCIAPVGADRRLSFAASHNFIWLLALAEWFLSPRSRECKGSYLLTLRRKLSRRPNFAASDAARRAPPCPAPPSLGNHSVDPPLPWAASTTRRALAQRRRAAIGVPPRLPQGPAGRVGRTGRRSRRPGGVLSRPNRAATSTASDDGLAPSPRGRGAASPHAARRAAAGRERSSVSGPALLGTERARSRIGSASRSKDGSREPRLDRAGKREGYRDDCFRDRPEGAQLVQCRLPAQEKAVIAVCAGSAVAAHAAGHSARAVKGRNASGRVRRRSRRDPLRDQQRAGKRRAGDEFRARQRDDAVGGEVGAQGRGREAELAGIDQDLDLVGPQAPERRGAVGARRDDAGLLTSTMVTSTRRPSVAASATMEVTSASMAAEGRSAPSASRVGTATMSARRRAPACPRREHRQRRDGAEISPGQRRRNARARFRGFDHHDQRGLVAGRTQQLGDDQMEIGARGAEHDIECGSRPHSARSSRRMRCSSRA